MTTDTAKEQTAARVSDQIVETKHQVEIGGQQISYTVTTGTLVLNEEQFTKEKEGEPSLQQPRATIFFVAYTRDDVEDRAKRPITFSFNGGPGSSSVWLHLGVLGPRRVELTSEGFPLPPPGRLVDNEYSLLDLSDLVFIDPVSTGFSRAVVGQEPKQFHGFKKDIETVGDFIRLYTTRYQRWQSPKYLAGESYGTTRAAGLSGYLQERHGLYLNGLILISSVLNFQTLEFEPGNDLAYLLFLPTYAATAWYHKRLSDSLQQRKLSDLLAEVERYALEVYSVALMRGSSLPASERRHVADVLERYTGLPRSYIESSNLRIQIHRFVKELLRDQRRTVGRLDSRYTGFDRDAAGEFHEHDPSLSAIMGPYSAMFNAYIRGELGFESDLSYEILTERVWPWSYADFENKFVDVSETMRKAMNINPFLRVHVANGYYDLATPYFATNYTFNHLELEDEAMQRISMSFYEAGHMMYVQERSLAELKQQMATFINEA
jgi:carboxypeptidase C (cathepsin A)